MDKTTLARIQRVRKLQSGLAQASAAQAKDSLASETALSDRIAGLVAAVAPAQQQGNAVSFAAAAHFRERLHRSALTAADRVAAAERQAEAAAEAAREARRDQTAVEKLLVRAQADAALREIRALEETPSFRSLSDRLRHDPC
jgi:flagellar FliJ protein